MKNSNTVFKNLYKIIIFLLLLLFAVMNIDYGYREGGNVSSFYSEENNSIDAIYYGGSAAFVYWEPFEAYKKYGFTSYNYAENTVQPELYEYLIKETLEYQDPELLIIDARAFQYHDFDQPPTLYAYYNFLGEMPMLSKNRVSFIINEAIRRTNYSFADYFFDFSINHTKNDFNINMLLDYLFNKVNTNIYKGYIPIVKEDSLIRQNFETEVINAPSKDTQAILNNLLDYLDTINKDVLFVVSPYIETKEHKMIFNYVENSVKSRGYDFLDANEYYEIMNIDFEHDFYNEGHVSVFGSIKYTDFLSKYLCHNYELPNHLNDNNYQKWNSRIEEWNAYQTNKYKEQKELMEENLKNE